MKPDRSSCSFKFSGKKKKTKTKKNKKKQTKKQKQKQKQTERCGRSSLGSTKKDGIIRGAFVQCALCKTLSHLYNVLTFVHVLSFKRSTSNVISDKNPYN